MQINTDTMKSKALQIAFQSPFPPFRGGIATFSRYVFESLQDLKDVHLSGHNFTALYPPLVFPGKTQFTDEKMPLPDIKETVHAYNPLNWKVSANAIMDEAPDVYLYSHWHPFFCPVQLRIIHYLKQKNPSIKVAGLLHNVIPHEKFPLQHYLTRSLFLKTDIPVVLSGQTLDEFTSLRVRQQPIKLFHPVYTQEHPEESVTEIRSKFGATSDETILLFFGLVRPYKGLDILIDALNGLDMKSLGLRLFVVGEFYMDKQTVLSKIDTANKPFIHIRDEFVHDAEAALYMKCSDVMVLPYRTASQSGILSNALNFHLPVICSNHAGLAEQVNHGKSGLLTEPENVVELRDAIVAMLNKPHRERMRVGVAELKETLSWNRFAQALREVLTN